ncbi:hypothetical protein [Burkholderia lata]|uniref:hypothetical protein n=1 Tax=Burkholderia lata (strain ATCC 17760 / DSM 23089 / LMG 22485 / NCIMB 9086 / R18194 / 383) TaxID=482957 RepID=UPI0015842171|nr:hypothetical protein [Burkholderia lata]
MEILSSRESSTPAHGDEMTEIFVTTMRCDDVFMPKPDAATAARNLTDTVDITTGITPEVC